MGKSRSTCVVPQMREPLVPQDGPRRWRAATTSTRPISEADTVAMPSGLPESRRSLNLLSVVLTAMSVAEGQCAMINCVNTRTRAVLLNKLLSVSLCRLLGTNISCGFCLNPPLKVSLCRLLGSCVFRIECWIAKPARIDIGCSETSF